MAEPGSELATMSTRSKPSEPLFNENHWSVTCYGRLSANLVPRVSPLWWPRAAIRIFGVVSSSLFFPSPGAGERLSLWFQGNEVGLSLGF